MAQLTEEPIDTAHMLSHATHPEAGAVAMFLGTTREVTDGRRTVQLQYDAYREMAERELAQLEEEARRRWPLRACQIVHRLGNVEPSEVSVAIVVATPHRGEAFEAAQWLINELKEKVPIWKCEHWSDGQSAWVHPGIAPP